MYYCSVSLTFSRPDLALLWVNGVYLLFFNFPCVTAWPVTPPTTPLLNHHVNNYRSFIYQHEGKNWFMWIFYLLKQFSFVLCNKLSSGLNSVSPHPQHLIFAMQIISVVIKKNKLKEITWSTSHSLTWFISWGGKWKDNIGWMVLKLHYKRASMCLSSSGQIPFGEKWGNLYQWSKKHASLNTPC